MLGAALKDGSSQMVARKDQMESLIKKGWECVDIVDDKVILKLPDVR